MRRPWVGFVVFIVLIAAAVSAIWFWGGNGDWGSHHDQVVRVVNADGTAIGPGNTIVIESRRGGPFFPFFFLFPLFIFGFFFLMRRAFWGPRRSPWTNPGAGPNGTPPPAWFDEWHRQAHGGGNLAHEHGSAPDTAAQASDPDVSEKPESR